MDHIDIERILEENFSKKSSIFIVDFIHRGDLDLRSYEKGQVVFPYSPMLSILARGARRVSSSDEETSLTMPESVFLKILEDMEASEFKITKLEMVGKGSEKVLFNSKNFYIDYDIVEKLLNYGFTLKNCIFHKNGSFIGVSRYSSLWSNDIKTLGLTSERVAINLDSSLMNFVNLNEIKSNENKVYRAGNILQFKNQFGLLESLLERIGKKRVSLIRKMRNGTSIFYVLDSKRNGGILVQHTYDSIKMRVFAQCSVNLIIDVAEAIEKSGGVFIGR